MKRCLQRMTAPFRAAWRLVLATTAAGILPVLIIIGLHEKARQETGRVSISAVEAGCYDWLFRRQPTVRRDHILLVRITEAAWDRLDVNCDDRVDRVHLATALRRIADQGPRLVVFDCLLSEATGDTNDQALLREMRRLGPDLILATSELNSNLQPAAFFAAGVTLANADVPSGIGTNRGHTVRRLPWLLSTNAQGRSIASVVARKLEVVSQDRREDTVDRWLRYYGPESTTNDGPFEVEDFTNLALGDASRFAPTTPGPWRDKVVFLGDARAGRDPFTNPVDGRDISGMEVHATAVANLRGHEWLKQASARGQVLFILAWGLALALFLDACRTPRARFAVVAATLLLVVATVLLQRYGGVWWWWLIPVAFQAPLALAVSTLPGGFQFFISYCDSDGRKEAQWLEGEISGAGFRAFLAPGNIELGASLRKELERRIRRARVFVLVLTPAALAELRARKPSPDTPGSPTPSEERWVLKEVAYALRRRRTLCVLRVETAAPEASDLEPEIARMNDDLSKALDINNRDQLLREVLKARRTR